MRRLIDFTLLVAALAAGGGAVWGLRYPWGNQVDAPWLWWTLIAAGLLGGVALRRMETWIPEARPAARPVAEPAALRRRLGSVSLALAVALTGAVMAWLWPNFRQWQGTQWPWLAALGLTIAGGWLLAAVGEPAVSDTPTSGAPPLTPESVPRVVEVLAFLAIAVLALVLRTYRLDQIPAGIYVDETNGALDALYIIEGRGDSPFGTGWYETPNGYAFYMAALFQWFGATYNSLKAASIIPAVLTVLALYPLGRVLFGPLTALSAMLLFAVSRWHLTMSRWGWNETAPPLFQVLATFYLVRGLRDRRGADFALGGVIAGLMVYTYLSSRLALATLGLFAVYWLVTDPEGPIASWRRHAPGFILFLLAALIAIAPIAVTYITNPFSFTNRMAQISIFNEVRETHSYQPLIDNIVRHLKFFHFRGDMSGKHNLPGEPETDPITGLLFVVGLGYGLVRLRDRRRGLLWLWVIFAMVGGIFSVRHESPQAYRTLTAVPAIALLAGDVLVRTARSLVWLAPAGGLRGVRTALAGVVVAAGLGGAAWWEIGTYFGPQATSAAVRGSFNLMENWASKDVIAALDRGDVVYLSPRFYDFSPLRFLVYGVMKAKTGGNTLEERPYKLARPELDLPLPDTGQDALYLVDSYYWPVIDYFKRFYPAAQYDLVNDPEQRPLYVRVRIPQAQIAALQGLRLRVRPAKGAAEERVVASIDQEWAAPPPLAAEWSGGFRTDHSADVDFTGSGGLSIVVDGQPWTGPRFLGRGLHALRVTQEQPGRTGRAVLSWKTGDGAVEAVPPQALFQIEPPHEGLLAHYYANDDWSGEPRFSQITPFLLLVWPDGEPFPPPFSVRFTGTLRIGAPGTYAFRVNADDTARLSIDGRVVGEAMERFRVNQFTAKTELSAGDHALQLDYVQAGGSSALEFYWQPPGRGDEPVPPSALVPGPAIKPVP